MTRCFDDTERLARSLVNFHEDLAVLRATSAPYWRAQGAISLLDRALSLEQRLLRSPHHEALFCLEELRKALSFAATPAALFLERLPRWIQRHGRGWLRRARWWAACCFDVNPSRRALAEEFCSPRGGSDPFLEALSDERQRAAFPRDLSLLCALLDQGLRGEASELAASVDFQGRSEALARIGIARISEGSSLEDVWNFHEITGKSERLRARLGALVATQERGACEEAIASLDALGGRGARTVGASLLAERLWEQDARTAAQELLERFDDGGPRGMLLRAQWRFDDGGSRPARALRFAAGLLESASAMLPALDRGAQGLLWDTTLPGRSLRSPCVTLELLRSELRLRQDPSRKLTEELARMAPILRALLVRSDEVGAWFASRLRAVESARGRPLIAGDERSSAADRGRALLLLAPGKLARGDAEQLAWMQALVAGIRGRGWDEARRTGCYGDASAPLRAAFDEGISLGPERDRRRSALTQVCRRVLRDGQRGQGTASAQVLASRVRCLVQLGEPPVVSDLLAEVLAATSPEGRGTLAVFSALARLAPAKAQAILMTRFEALLRSSPGLLRRVPVLPELVSQGISRILAYLSERNEISFQEGCAWIGQLLSGWWEEHGTVPPAGLLFALLARISEELYTPWRDPARLLTQLLSLSDEVASLPPETLLADLACEKRSNGTLVMLTLSGFSEPEPRWPLSSWRRIARRALDEIGVVQPGLVHRWSKALASGKNGQQIARALLRGEAPVALPRALPLERGYQLCWLEKGRDLLAFLRFADCVQSCMNSASTTYRSSMDTQRSVLAIHRDPFSFCFRIQHQLRSGDVRPEGFLFGSMGLSDRGPVLLLNGVYLRRQIPAIRKRVLEQIEEHLARPLGVRWIGVASRHGGRGELPDGYASRQSIKVRRLRALVEAGGTLARQCYDDLGIAPNQEIASPPHIFWRALT